MLPMGFHRASLLAAGSSCFLLAGVVYGDSPAKDARPAVTIVVSTVYRDTQRMPGALHSRDEPIGYEHVDPFLSEWAIDIYSPVLEVPITISGIERALTVKGSKEVVAVLCGIVGFLDERAIATVVGLNTDGLADQKYDKLTCSGIVSRYDAYRTPRYVVSGRMYVLHERVASWKTGQVLSVNQLDQVSKFAKSIGIEFKFPKVMSSALSP